MIRSIALVLPAMAVAVLCWTAAGFGVFAVTYEEYEAEDLRQQLILLVMAALAMTCVSFFPAWAGVRFVLKQEPPSFALILLIAVGVSLWGALTLGFGFAAHAHRPDNQLLDLGALVSAVAVPLALVLAVRAMTAASRGPAS